MSDPGLTSAAPMGWWATGVCLVAVGGVCLLATIEAVEWNKEPDFFINWTGVGIGLRGESPYDLAKIRARVARQFPDEETLGTHCGFFLPPQAIPLFAPFALLPYPAAKVLWALGLGLSAAATLLVFRSLGTFWPTTCWGQFVPAVVLLNYLTVAVIELGQTSFLFVGSVAAGQWCFERGRTTAGAILWAIPFLKPHLALPLLPLAWYLGGWRRAAAVLAVVAILNVVGCLMIRRSPLFLLEYVEFLGSAHKAVMFNRVDSTPELTSWNKLLFVATEAIPDRRCAIDLTAVTTMTGYVVWLGLVVGRCVLAREKPSAAWATAAAAIGGVLCAQVLFYELMFLAVAIPWVRELLAGGGWLRGWLGAGLLAVQLVPVEVVGLLGVWSHRPLAVALLVVLLLSGPINQRSHNSRG